jgi:hypothetical protein
MLPGPIGDEPQRTRGQLAGDHGEGLDVDRGLVTGVAGVE